MQVRFDGWVTEMNDDVRMMDTSGDQSDGRAAGIDNLLYSADAEFSCFADLALVSPGEYYKEGEGSLIQAVFDERAFKRSDAQLVEDCVTQLNDLFPSSKKLKCTWSKVTKLGQSLYREKIGQDKFRPTQATPVENFFLAGSYTYQVRPPAPPHSLAHAPWRRRPTARRTRSVAPPPHRSLAHAPWRRTISTRWRAPRGAV